jgi:hypothetical protein
LLIQNFPHRERDYNRVLTPEEWVNLCDRAPQETAKL